MTGDRGSEQRPSQVWSVLDPVVIGLLAAAVSLAGAARPSFWYDEAATISAAYSRSLGQLWQMVGEVDAVHGLYYLLMHGWFQLFAPTEFWSRAPSGLAVGAAAAGLVVLGKQLCSRGVGVTSGAVCAILPRATWAGIEARPYAMSMMAAVWLTVLLVYAARRDTAWVWVTYGAVLAVSIVLDVYLALLSAVHLGFVLVAPYGRTVVLRVLLTALVVLGATAPLVFVAMGQVHQIAWITPIGSRTLEDVAVQQYFDRSPPFAIVSALVVAVAIVVWLFTSRRMDVGQRTSVVLASAWLAIPTGIIVIWSVLAHPIYTPRYLCFTAPAMALLLGVCIVSVFRSPWLAAAVVTLLAVTAAPNFVVVQSGPYAKWGMDYSQVADLITAKAASGDCLLVNDTVTFHPAPMRPLMAARPDAYQKLIDTSLWQRATDINAVFDTNLIPEASVGPLEHCRQVWIITQADPTRPAYEQGSPLDPGPQYGGTPAFRVPATMGFRLWERWQFNLVQVIRASR